mgnify:CR=1 FL=1
MHRKKDTKYIRMKNQDSYRMMFQEMYQEMYQEMKNDTYSEQVITWLLRCLLELYVWVVVINVMWAWQQGYPVTFVALATRLGCVGVLAFETLKGILGKPVLAEIRLYLAGLLFVVVSFF